MRISNVGRRQAIEMLGALAVTGLLAGSAVFPRRAAAQPVAATWNKEAFGAQAVDEVLRALGAGIPAATHDVSWGATPEFAENGAVVPVNIVSNIAGTQSIAIIVEKNPNKLAAMFFFADGTEPAVATRLKMSESSNVHVVVRTKAGQSFMATRQIRVLVGGCGG